jgi:hypothetical protein
VMGARVTATPSFSSAAVTRLLDGTGYNGAGRYGSSRTYDVGGDGRFLMIKLGPRDAAASPSLIVVHNWFEELKRLAPAR